VQVNWGVWALPVEVCDFYIGNMSTMLVFCTDVSSSRERCTKHAVILTQVPFSKVRLFTFKKQVETVVYRHDPSAEAFNRMERWTSNLFKIILVYLRAYKVLV
jgi:hypothetical protein